MLKQLIKKTAYTIAPRIAADIDGRHWLGKCVRDLRRRAADCQTPVDYLVALDAVHAFPAWQNKSEILALMDVVAELQPRRACEIGTMEGGTLFLLTQMCAPGAHVVSLDRHFTPARRLAFPQFALRQQRITLLEADSHAPETLDRLESLLDFKPLDFLFIDGDHAEAGVEQDFITFAQLVRPGGVIAFHDIVPDHRAQGLAPTRRDSGGVPQFWQRLKKRHPHHRELIDHPDQDGCGIGLIYWNT